MRTIQSEILAGLLGEQEGNLVNTNLIIALARLVQRDLAAARDAKWRWHSFHQITGDVFRPCQGKQGSSGERINYQHPAWQHDTHSGKYRITVFLVPLLTCVCFSWTSNLSSCSSDVSRWDIRTADFPCLCLGRRTLASITRGAALAQKTHAHRSSGWTWVIHDVLTSESTEFCQIHTSRLQ